MPSSKSPEAGKAGGRIDKLPDSLSQAFLKKQTGELPPDPGTPGVALPFPMPRYCGVFDIKIARDGVWYYKNSPIGRKPLCKLFASVMHCDERGGHWLITPAERGQIEVETAPFIAVTMEQKKENGQNCLRFTTNLDDTITASSIHPLTVEMEAESPLPFILVRGRLRALLTRAVFYDLANMAYPVCKGKQEWLAVDSAGETFLLGKMN